jgi:hypothetical protein
MEAVQDMGGATSNRDTTRLAFPKNSSKAKDQQNLLELIKKKESQRLSNARLGKGRKSKKLGKSGPSGVLTYTKDGRTIQRKGRITKNFTHDSVLLKQHHHREA